MEHRIFSAEQIAVPPALPSILKAWTKAIIRANPDDVNAWSADYFKEKLASLDDAKEAAPGGS